MKKCDTIWPPESIFVKPLCCRRLIGKSFVWNNSVLVDSLAYPLIKIIIVNMLMACINTVEQRAHCFFLSRRKCLIIFEWSPFHVFKWHKPSYKISCEKEHNSSLGFSLLLRSFFYLILPSVTRWLSTANRNLLQRCQINQHNRFLIELWIS